MAKSKRGKSAKSSNSGKTAAKKASNKSTNKSTAAGKRDADGCGERCCAWKGVFAPVLKGCPYNFDSDKMDSDSDEDDSSDDEEEDTAHSLQICDKGLLSNDCNNYVHRKCDIKAYNIAPAA